MRTAVAESSVACYHAHIEPSAQGAQCARILSFIEKRRGDWSIGEIAKALSMEKSTVSARLNYMVHKTKELEEQPHRKDKVSGITIRPVGIPATQRDLF